MQQLDDADKDNGSGSEDFPEPKRKKSKVDSRRHSLERPLPAMAALLAPKLSTAPEIPFHNYQPQLNLSTPVEDLAPEESALGFLAQVAHEMEPTITAPYFADADVLPPDLADSLIQLYPLPALIGTTSNRKLLLPHPAVLPDHP